MKFVIDLVFGYDKLYNGGVIVLHKLAYELALRGNTVYTFCEPQYKHENIIVLPYDKNTVSYDWNSNLTNVDYTFSDDTISIYPEIRKGNPFGTSKVVRWILSDNLKAEIEKTYNESDMYFTYEDSFINNSNYKKSINKLTVLDDNLNNLYQTNGKREGYCHILHKNTPKNHYNILNKYNSKDLSDWKSKGMWNYLREEFNKCEFFLTFDDRTYFSIAAALCGCKSIIIPTENNKEKYINPSDFRIKNPNQMVGVSYGFDDIEWTEKTKDLTRTFIIERKKINDKTIDDFIEYFKNKIN